MNRYLTAFVLPLFLALLAFSAPRVLAQHALGVAFDAGVGEANGDSYNPAIERDVLDFQIDFTDCIQAYTDAATNFHFCMAYFRVFKILDSIDEDTGSGWVNSSYELGLIGMGHDNVEVGDAEYFSINFTQYENDLGKGRDCVNPHAVWMSDMNVSETGGTDLYRFHYHYRVDIHYADYYGNNQVISAYTGDVTRQTYH